jgi:hypothetical protein
VQQQWLKESDKWLDKHAKKVMFACQGLVVGTNRHATAVSNGEAAR